MNLNTEFKRDPVAFMGKYLFYWQSRPSKAGTYYFAFDEIDKTKVALGDVDSAKNDAIKAYYLPYADNHTYVMTLGSDASYMFTPTLTGCTFVTNKKWYTPKISHLNYQFSTGLNKGSINQNKIATDVSSNFGKKSTDYHIVTKRDYISQQEEGIMDAVRLTIVGVKGFWGWYFYKVKVTKGTDLGKVERIN